MICIISVSQKEEEGENSYCYMVCKGQNWIKIKQKVTEHMGTLKPLTPMNDQDRISPCNVNTISSRQVMRTKKYIKKRIFSWPTTKFSELTS